MVVGESETLQLTEDPLPDYSPAWSPNGRRIAFLRDRADGKAEVRLVSPLGGAETKVTEIATPRKGSSFARSLSWHPNGRGLVVSDAASPNDPVRRLYLVSTEGGQRRELTNPPGEGWGDMFGAFSADGTRLAFSRAVRHFDNRLLVQRFSVALRPKSQPAPVTQGTPSTPRTCVWTEGQRDLVFSPYSPGPLWRVDADDGGEPRKLTFAGNRVFDPTISYQSERLAFARWSTEQNIWRLDLPYPGGPATAAMALISSIATDMHHIYSPNGQRIVFRSNRFGSFDSFACDKDGSNLVKISSYGTGWSYWSPNGKYLVGEAPPGDIAVGTVDGGVSHRIVDDPAVDVSPSWSRDGLRIYFASKHIGEFQVWKIPSQGGAPSQVTQHGGFFSEESADGRFLYYSKSLGRPTSLWRVPVGGGEETLVLESLSNYHSFTVVLEGIYFIPAVEPGANPSIRFLHFETGRITTVKDLDRPVPTWGNLSASPNGRHLLYTQIDREGSDLMLVENFR